MGASSFFAPPRPPNRPPDGGAEAGADEAGWVVADEAPREKLGFEASAADVLLPNSPPDFGALSPVEEAAGAAVAAAPKRGFAGWGALLSAGFDPIPPNRPDAGDDAGASAGLASKRLSAAVAAPAAGCWPNKPLDAPSAGLACPKLGVAAAGPAFASFSSGLACPKPNFRPPLLSAGFAAPKVPNEGVAEPAPPLPPPPSEPNVLVCCGGGPAGVVEKERGDGLLAEGVVFPLAVPADRPPLC